MDYGKLDLHMAISDVFSDEDEIMYGFAIESKDETSFFMDLEALIKRYGGAPFDELLMEDDEDESFVAAMRHRKGVSKARLRDAIIDVMPTDASSAK